MVYNSRNRAARSSNSSIASDLFPKWQKNQWADPRNGMLDADVESPIHCRLSDDSYHVTVDSHIVWVNRWRISQHVGVLTSLANRCLMTIPNRIRDAKFWSSVSMLRVNETLLDCGSDYSAYSNNFQRLVKRFARMSTTRRWFYWRSALLFYLIHQRKDDSCCLCSIEMRNVTILLSIVGRCLSRRLWIYFVCRILTWISSCTFKRNGRALNNHRNS